MVQDDKSGESGKCLGGMGGQCGAESYINNPDPHIVEGTHPCIDTSSIEIKYTSHTPTHLDPIHRHHVVLAPRRNVPAIMAEAARTDPGGKYHHRNTAVL